MSHTDRGGAFLNRRAQSHLNPARALVVERWVVLVPFCRVPYLWMWAALNQNDSHIRQSSNVKLFGAQRRLETAAIFGVDESNVQLWRKLGGEHG
jgi:hypothetical protein